MSASQSRLTASDQRGTFCTSSSTSSAPCASLSRSRRRAASHWVSIHSGPRSVGSSALAKTCGSPDGVGNVRDQRRLADLARAGDDLDEAPRLFEAPKQLCRLWPDVFLTTHRVE